MSRRRSRNTRASNDSSKSRRGRGRGGKSAASSPAVIAVGKKARERRVEAGYTLREASLIVGLSHSQLSRVERGAVARLPKRTVLIALASAYGCPVEEFLDAAELSSVEPSTMRFSEEQQFGNLMLHDDFGPEGMRPEFLAHFPPLHQRLVLEMFLRTWYAAVQHTQTGGGPVPDDVLGEPPPWARSDALPRFASRSASEDPRVQRGLFEEDEGE